MSLKQLHPDIKLIIITSEAISNGIFGSIQRPGHNPIKD